MPNNWLIAFLGCLFVGTAFGGGVLFGSEVFNGILAGGAVLGVLLYIITRPG